MKSTFNLFWDINQFEKKNRREKGKSKRRRKWIPLGEGRGGFERGTREKKMEHVGLVSTKQKNMVGISSS